MAAALGQADTTTSLTFTYTLRRVLSGQLRLVYVSPEKAQVAPSLVHIARCWPHPCYRARLLVALYVYSPLLAGGASAARRHGHPRARCGF